MKALLLVAGVGSRLRPLTDTVPKCMLKINRKPLLQIWLEKLDGCGVKDILVNTHLLPDKIEKFLKRCQIGEQKVTTIHEPELLGSAGTLWANRERFDDDQPFFIIYGDNLTDMDLNEMLKFHKKHGMLFTLGVFKSERPTECGIVEVNEAGTVISFEEKPAEPKSDMAAAGVYIADRRLIGFFPEGAGSIRPLDLGFHVLPKLVGKMKGFPIAGTFIDIGTPDAYERAQYMWRIKGKNIRGKYLC